MKLEQLAHEIHYTARIPERPEGISPGRWFGMVRCAVNYLYHCADPSPSWLHQEIPNG